jgi:hypothetical protein
MADRHLDGPGFLGRRYGEPAFDRPILVDAARRPFDGGAVDLDLAYTRLGDAGVPREAHGVSGGSEGGRKDR